MSRRSKAAYFSQLDRPISWCDNAHEANGCGNKNARLSKKDGKRLCKSCRAKAHTVKLPLLPHDRLPHPAIAFYVDPDEREDHGESFGELYAALVRGPL